MSDYLLLVNAKQHPKTEKFWIQNQEDILHTLSDATVFIPDFDMDDWPTFNAYSTIVMVGDDSFFSQALNTIYQKSAFTDKTLLAFIPDSKDSSIRKILDLPSSLKELLHLITVRQSIFIDLIKCSYIDRSGFPSTYLAVNDVLIGAAACSISPLAKTFVKWLLTTFSPQRKQNNTVTIFHHDQEIYNGPYIMAILLLGNYITKGPKIRAKRNLYKRKFDIFQIRGQSLLKLTSSLSKMFLGKGKQQIANHWELDEAEFKSPGKKRNIIADGVHIGRLPANFHLLPKAVKVVSAFSTVKVKSRWKGIVPATVNASDPLTRMHRTEEHPED